MNLLLGVPTAGSPAKPFLDSLATLTLPLSLTGVDRMTVGGNFVPAQREIILRAARKRGFDAVAMFDDDMVLPPDALVRLLDVFERNPKCAVAGGLYYSRDGLRPMAVSGWHERNTTAAWTPAFDESTPVEVDGVGFGCVLIRASVLERMSEPYLRTQIFIQESARIARLCNEDYLFCASVRELGFEVFLDPGVRCGHYDRGSARTIPQTWEPAEITSQKRMTVRDSSGVARLVPLDDSVGHAKELHVAAQLEYVYASEDPAQLT